MSEQPGGCERFAAVVNAVLDGDAAASALLGGHPEACPDCRGLAAAARLLAGAGPGLRLPPVPPAHLRGRLVRTVQRSRRRRLAVPVLALSLAAVVGVWAGWPARPEPVAVVPTPGPKLADQWAAVAGVARQATARAAEPARLLVPPAVTLPAAPPTPDPSTPFRPLEQAARAGAEPVAGTARRAVGLFLRDFGPKPTS